jgi:quercetin dioxygenase-like cupin family protein
MGTVIRSARSIAAAALLDTLVVSIGTFGVPTAICSKGGHMEKLAFLKFTRVSLLVVVLAMATVVLATPTFNIVLNQIVATGTKPGDISEFLHVGSHPNREAENSPTGESEDDDWQLHLRTRGATDFYVQHLVVGPGGYSGWHSHPGLLIGTVVSGSIDFYDAHCHKRSFAAGQVFTENTEVHAIINTGVANADLSIAYLIKHNLPRRIEADAPVCAPSTGIP